MTTDPRSELAPLIDYALLRADISAAGATRLGTSHALAIIGAEHAGSGADHDR